MDRDFLRDFFRIGSHGGVRLSAVAASPAPEPVLLANAITLERPPKLPTTSGPPQPERLLTTPAETTPQDRRTNNGPALRPEGIKPEHRTAANNVIAKGTKERRTPRGDSVAADDDTIFALLFSNGYSRFFLSERL